MFSRVFFSFKLCMCQDPRITRAHTAQNTKNCVLLACVAQPTYLIPARCGTDAAGRGTFKPPPKDGARTKRFDQEFQFRESHTEAETDKLLTESKNNKTITCIFMPHLTGTDFYLFECYGFRGVWRDGINFTAAMISRHCRYVFTGAWCNGVL